MKKTCGVLILGAILLMSLPQPVQSQMVFLARKAVGAVSHIVNKEFGHESASVILEADAAKVYAAALKILGKNPQVHITSKNEDQKMMAFSYGQLNTSLKVVTIQEGLCQLLVTASGKDGEADTHFVLDRVLGVCKETGVHCWLAKE